MLSSHRFPPAALAVACALVVLGSLRTFAVEFVVDDQPPAPGGFSAPTEGGLDSAAPPTPTVDRATPMVEPLNMPPMQNGGDEYYGDEYYDDSYDGSDGYVSDRFWIRAEYLLWFTRGVDIPALVTTSPANTSQANAGVLGTTGATVLYGNEDIAHKARSGGRLSFGYWFDDYQDLGLVASGFGVSHDQNTGNFSANSTGNPILARPFFNAQTNLQDSELVAFPNIVSGQVSVSSTSELQSGNVALRWNRYAETGLPCDCLLGYRFFRLREGLRIEEDLVSTNPSGLVQQGTTLDLFDSFNTNNDFHGVDLGFVYDADVGSWFTFDTTFKVALGTMYETVSINGQTVVTTPGDPSATSAGGLLALPSNIGTYHRNEFCVVPELNVNLHYWLTERLNLTFGYTGIYVSRVARAADQIDTRVDPRQLPGFGQPSGGATNAPAALFTTTDLWLQGANFGMEFVW